MQRHAPSAISERPIRRVRKDLAKSGGRRLQTKLTLGPPGDRYEQEADRVAKQVMSSIDVASGPSLAAQRQPEEEELMAKRLQRQPEEEELMMKPLLQRQPEEEELMMKPVVQRAPEEEEMLQGKLQLKSTAEPGPVTADLEQQINGSRAGGKPLDASVQASMSEAFGADFSAVRVHTGQAADDLNSSLQSRAFTTGNDIFFRSGDYTPTSRAGQERIANERRHSRAPE